MKKLFSGKFLFILASSIVMLVLLTIGAFYLFNDEDAVFVKSGYVLNPLSSTMEKYFFDENAGYKENLSSMVEFIDVDENTVSVLKDSFLHYLDDSLSFLKKGAILDLNSVSGNKAVSFYNITANSIIEKKDNRYVIESASGDINLNNFIGRISDNKYIVVGDLSLKMAGNDTSIKGDYFEVVYVETGIVNIENKDIKYQVAAEDTIIYVGNDKLIDLGDKKIVVNGQDLMSMTAITIDGDENIEIIPKEPTEEEEPDNNTDIQTPPVEETPGIQDGQTGGDGTGDGTGTGEDDPVTEEKEEVIITLKDEKIGSTSIGVVFEVLNANEEDVYKLQVVNLASGKTVDVVARVLTDVPISVNLLTPSTKYLFTVVEEESNEKHFQKVIETSSFGITLEKMYATANSLAYEVNVDDDADISNAKLSLYKFNEETGKNEIVTTSYVDSVTGETKTEEKVVSLSSLQGGIDGKNKVLFDGLESDTIYTAVLDEFSVASSNFKDIYNITNTAMTLKQIPKFSEMSITKDVGAGSFDLSLGNINDPDNAIVGYTYVIYDKLDDSKPAVPEIHKNNASPITVKVGDDDDELKNDTNYYYNVIIEYFDNEKYIEYVTTDSIIFLMGNEPYITVVPKNEAISHDSLGATLYLTDNSCLISMPGRERCPGVSTVVLEVSEVNPLTGTRRAIYTENITFEITEESIKYDLFLDNTTVGLLDKIMPGSTYSIMVRASYNTSDALEKVEIAHTEESVRTITTKELSSFNVAWSYIQGTTDIPINATTRFTADENSGTLSPEESINTINQVVINVYEGKNTTNLASMKPLGSRTYTKSNTFSIKEKFYDSAYSVTSNGTFGLTLQDLKDMSTDGKLNENYVISINAYTVTGYEVRLFNNVYVYRISSLLLMEDTTEPTITKELTYYNKDVDNYFENLNDKYFQSVPVGYSFIASFDRTQLEANNIVPEKVHFYVYDSVTNARVKFYTKGESGLTLVDQVTGVLEGSSFYITDIYFDYGTSYETVDDIMRRGNKYYVGYVVECMADGKRYYYPENKTVGLNAEYGTYIEMELSKASPSMKMYPASSSKDSVTYSYVIKDPDNYLYKNPEDEELNFYYQINSGVVTPIAVKLVGGATYNHLEGNLTISGLKNKDIYNLYYMSNIIRSGDPVTDVIPNYDFGTRMFDGYYDAKTNMSTYNFRYQVINNPLKDNKVIIKILASEEIVDRIVSYELEFTDSKGNKPLNKTLWQLAACPGDSEETAPRCLSVDYTELKNAGMKSEENNINMISVKVTAFYDNGLTGYDYSVGNNEDDDYKYCIMQVNSSELGFGNYISFTASNSQVTVWAPELDVSKGFYQYAFGSETLIRYWGRHTNKTTPNNISVNLKFSGYESKDGYLNPKMISIDTMECVGDNQFYFSSITPKVAVSQKSALINGTALNLALSGVDLNDLKRENDGEYYLYVETWLDNLDSVDLNKAIRPAVKVKINSASPTTTINAIVDGLKENTNHYFRIYTYMKDNNGKYQYTQLFNAAIDTGYVTSSYSYRTARASDIFHNFSTSVSTSDEVYGNRILSTKMNLYAYANNIAFNFDLVYILCDSDSEIPCGLGEGETHLFKQTVPQDKVSTSVSDTLDISKYDLEFGKNYYMYIYAHADYYDNGTLTKRDIVLNRTSVNVKFKTLVEPTYVVTRNAGIENDSYYIDFDIVVNDMDRTLVNGNYFIKLLDETGNLVGSMKLKDSNGGYYDVSNYGEYAFDAFVVSKNVRITNLEPNAKYTFVVYGDAYINNYSEDTLPGIEHRTYEVSRSYTVYSANDYGIAFGNAITYGATEKSIIVTFLGGSNFDNVVELNYTIGLWNAADDSSTISGTYVIGENGKYFELYSGTEDWRFVIDPSNMKNTLGKSYEVSISVKVKVPGTDKFMVLTSADIPGFEGKAVYVEDE